MNGKEKEGGERKRRRTDEKGTRWGGITMGFSLPKVNFLLRRWKRCCVYLFLCTEK